MGSKITFTEKAFSEYIEWQSTDKRTTRKINRILKDICRNPFDGIGKPEPLKNNLSGFWSRRIDETNRIVYRIDNDILEICQCKGHYNDK